MMDHGTAQRTFASCRRATELISKAQDVPLDSKERFALRLHLLLCRWCRRYEKQIHVLRSLMSRRRAGDGITAVELPAEARERIRRALTS